jgi:circadian clock protein KaiC
VGPAGSGKSTLAAFYGKAAVERGERVAFFVFDEAPSTLMIRGEALDFDVARHEREGRMIIRHVDPAELSPGQFASHVCRAVEHGGATMVVIDSINGYQSAMPEEHFLSAHLHELLAYLNQHQVATILIMTQSGVIGEVSSPIDLSYLADSVIVLRYFETDGEMRLAVSMLKRRTGPHERTIRELRLGQRCLTVGEPLRGFQGIMSGNLVLPGQLSQRWDEGR